ncbi:sulfate transporter family-domain-containing protein [Gigaspora rosea]|uniref:Sulfate transporter family-domain-containing protein n=1 Tax=Gigaspora rosea TaxID=44941 RepID=A0A397U4J6_9GLOM|nr:sulfate transporter family-domain-containing protein [Gigaspora rosea]
MTDYPYIFDTNKPRVKEKTFEIIREFPGSSARYLKSLFPISTWINHYNLSWLVSDVIAGITVGLVVIPQSMGYAKVATLPVEYGLYSSFVGVSIYFLFATSKDITIGPTAVISLLMGQTIDSILKINTNYTNVTIAATFSLLTGFIALILGFLRLGFVVDFIPAPVVAGFTTGSGLNIAIGQVANLLGISGVDNKQPTYLVLISTLKALGRTKFDAIIGLLGLLFLYTIKYGSSYLSRRYPNREKLFFFFGIARNCLLVVICTFIAYLLNIGRTTSPISILKTVPSGFNHIGSPNLDHELVNLVSGFLPGVSVVLILEHVAIAKSFGRINDYKIVASQELIAVGATNAIGSFFGAYPATGSFSRSAINAKSGVRTPLAGIFSGALVIASLYFLTPAFYYIPNAALSAVIIHAVLNLISGPAYIKQIWKIQFWDFMVFVLGVVFNFFFNVEIGIYVSAGVALVLLLVRLARPRFYALGRLEIASSGSKQFTYVPLCPMFQTAQSPPDGVLIFRFDESLTYPNSSYVEDQIVNYVKSHTRRVTNNSEKVSDRSWSDVSSDYENKAIEMSKLPKLNAIVFDFSAVSTIDSTGVQALVDIKKHLEKHTGDVIEYHFANILNENIQRALIVAGFGEPEQKKLLIDVGITEVPSDEASDITPDEIDIPKETAKLTVKKKYLHLSLHEAVTAATNGAW